MTADAKAQQYSSRHLNAVDAPPGTPITSLRPGWPNYDNVKRNSYKYYKVTVNTTGVPEFDIDLSTFSGDPDMFVTTNGVQYPSWLSYDYASIGFEDEHVAIKAGDEHNHCSRSQPQCTLYISVYGFSNATYLLWVSGQSTIVELVNGMPEARTAYPGQLDFFSFYPSAQDEPVVFQTTVEAPNAAEWELSLYATVGSISTTPSPSNYIWRSVGDNGYHYTNIVIPAADRYNCAGSTDCRFYLAVSAPAHHPDGIPYTMLATNSIQYITLQGNQRQMGHVEQGHTMLYSFYAMPNAHWTNITVVPQIGARGDPDIYVLAGRPTMPPPSAANFMWRSINVGGDSVNIHGADPEYSAQCDPFGCFMHIAVRGFLSSSYSITVTQDLPPQPTPSPSVRVE
jgi:hypothetical protein